MSKGKALIDELLASKKVVVVSKSYCPFCVKAKNVIDKYNMSTDKMAWLEIENRDDMAEIQDYCRDLTGARSVPRVFIGGKCIGGGNETASLESEGKLRPMLEQAGAL